MNIQEANFRIDILLAQIQALSKHTLLNIPPVITILNDIRGCLKEIKKCLTE